MSWYRLNINCQLLNIEAHRNVFEWEWKQTISFHAINFNA